MQLNVPDELNNIDYYIISLTSINVTSINIIKLFSHCDDDFVPINLPIVSLVYISVIKIIQPIHVWKIT